MDGASAEMPRYQCHKKVWALKIADLGAAEGGGFWMTPAETGYARIKLDHVWVMRHRPEIGGYYVVYDDGYASFSPAKAFLDGYTRI